MTNKYAEETIRSIINSFEKKNYYNNGINEFQSIPKGKQNRAMVFVDNIARLLNDILNKKLLFKNLKEYDEIWKNIFGWHYINENAQIREISELLNYLH